MKRLTFTSLAALLTLSTLLGCDQDDGPATVSVECRVNSDCPASLACVDSACVEPDQCLGDDCPCESDQDCQGDTLCDADTGQCYTPRCFADTDCALGQSCVRGVCGDNPQADRDGDSVADLDDNCPELPNTDQADNDADTTGDRCDSDDDNDALPDLADNCPLTANPVQGDADDDGLGNACDEDAPGITVEGSVDFSARPDADLANAQLLLSGVEAPATLSPDGTFTFPSALPEPGRHTVQVRWPGFVSVVEEFTAADGVLVVTLPTLVLAPVDEGPELVEVRAQVSLEGQDEAAGVVIRALREGRLADTTLSGDDGGFLLRLTEADHTLQLSREGFETLEVQALFTNTGFQVDGVPIEEAPLTLTALPTGTLLSELASDAGPRDDWSQVAVVSLNDGVANTFAGVANTDQGRGAFRFEGLSPGSYTLVARADGHTTLSQSVEVALGDNDLGLLTLEADPPDNVLLRGQVRLEAAEDDDENNGALILGLIGEDTVASAQSGASGVFAFTSQPQDHTLNVSAPNHLPRTFEVQWNADLLRFELNGQPLEASPLTLDLSPLSDLDGDGVIDVEDNCPRTFNVNQDNLDDDPRGDACDDDLDGDAIANAFDNCPRSFNPMQEDTDGLGLGTVCTLGSLQRPVRVGCGVGPTHLDTRQRTNLARGSCGGSTAPEVVFELGNKTGESWRVETQADFDRVIYVLDSEGDEVDCVIGGQALFEGLDEGRYRVVVDGLGDAAGAVSVQISSPEACGVNFELTSTAAVAPNGSQVAVGDIDSDGIPDLVTSHFDSPTLGILLGQPGGQLGAERRLTVGGRANLVVLGDINNDGHLDIVAGLYQPSTPSQVALMLGDGEGNFADPQLTPVGRGLGALRLDDLDRDGNLDVITSNLNNSNISVLMGSGDGNFEVQFVDMQNNYTLPIGDLNHDGHLDILGQREFAAGDGAGNFTLEEMPPGLPLSVMAHGTTGQFGGDGRDDVAIITNSDRSLEVYIAHEEGYLLATKIPLNLRAIDIVAAHLNEDAHLDLVTVTSDFDAIHSTQLHMGLGDGRFAAPTTLSTAFIRDCKTVDLNRDGRLDLALIDYESQVELRLTRASGLHQPSQIVASNPLNDTITLDSGDVDGNGTTEVLMARYFEGMSLLEFSDDVVSEQTIEGGEGPFRPQLADIDSDGDLDLLNLIIAEDAESPSIEVHINEGERGFSLRATLEFPGVFDIKMVDFNADDVPDIYAVAPLLNTIGLSLGDGQGGFAEFQTVQTGTHPGCRTSLNECPLSKFTDINDDGHLDAVVVNVLSNDVTILIGDGAGILTPGDTLSLPVESPHSMALQDRNGDGNVDLQVFMRPFGGSSSLFLLGDGLGGFDDPVAVDFSANGRAGYGDVDGDGYDDVVVANSNFPNGRLTISFGGPSEDDERLTEIDISLNPQSGTPVVTDIDGDGIPDIVLEGRNNDIPNQSMVLLFGVGDGTFDSELFFNRTFKRNLPLPIVGDFNGDGRSDILALGQEGLLMVASRSQGEIGASRITDAPLPACPPSAFELNEDAAWTLDPEQNCRIQRVEISLDLAQQGPITLTTPFDLDLTLAPMPDGRHRPELDAALARLEGSPLSGRWRLSADGEPLLGVQATLIVNAAPDDPFAPQTLADVCNPLEDQDSAVEALCRFDGAPLNALLDDADDRDAFLLEGPQGGAFRAGQRVSVQATTEPGAPLLIELRAHRASAALVTAEETDPGLWTLEWLVPPQYAGRNLSVHVQGPVADLNYEISATFE